VTMQSDVRGAVTVVNQIDDTGAFRVKDTGLAKMAILSLMLSCFSQMCTVWWVCMLGNTNVDG